MDVKKARQWLRWVAPAITLAILLVIGMASVTAAEPPIPPEPTPDPFAEEVADLDTRRELATRPCIITYTVQPGDTVSGIAARFGLDIDTIRWSNPSLERNPDYILPGTDLTILPIRGVYHQVVAGDTLGNIATRYGVVISDIVNYPLNYLSPDKPLQAGQWLIVPHGTKNVRRPKPNLALDYPFAWPIVGSVTQGYSNAHRAIDIGAPYGSAVYAARAGVVTHASWAETGYGYTVVIAHSEGHSTLYGHLKGAWVSVGQRVKRGQLIGEVGSTGNSSGPHVHFEIRVNDVRANPLDFLPAQ